MLMVPLTITTPTVMARVPRIAFSRPPPVPVVSVVSTLHWKTGTARAMTPPASHTVGTTITARQAAQATQNPALEIFLRIGIAGQSWLPTVGPTPGGADEVLPGWLIAYSPLPTGSAVPDTRRTSSRAATFALSVMTMSTRASSA